MRGPGNRSGRVFFSRSGFCMNRFRQSVFAPPEQGRLAVEMLSQRIVATIAGLPDPTVAKY